MNRTVLQWGASTSTSRMSKCTQSISAAVLINLSWCVLGPWFHRELGVIGERALCHFTDCFRKLVSPVLALNDLSSGG